MIYIFIFLVESNGTLADTKIVNFVKDTLMPVGTTLKIASNASKPLIGESGQLPRNWLTAENGGTTNIWLYDVLRLKFEIYFGFLEFGIFLQTLTSKHFNLIGSLDIFSLLVLRRVSF